MADGGEEWAKGEGKGQRWLVADYEVGDVVFHSQDAKGVSRLATDLRFCEDGANLD